MRTTVGAGNTVAVAEDRGPTDRTLPMSMVTRGLIGSGPDIRSRCRRQIRDDSIVVHALAVQHTDVRMRLLEIWETLQDGRVRRDGDACDSLVLEHEEVDENLDHRRPASPDTVASDTHAVEGNLDRDPSAPTVDRARHR